MVVAADEVSEVTWSLRTRGKEYDIVILEKGPHWSVVDLDNYLGNHDGAFAIWYEGASPYRCTGFSRSARNVHLINDNKTLSAELRNERGEWQLASADLNSMFGNRDGEFYFGSKDFTASASGIKLEGRLLMARLQSLEGSERRTYLPLNNVLGNMDGRFVWGQTGSCASGRQFQILGSMHSIVECELKNWKNEWQTARIDLDEIIGNIDGTLTAKQHQFSTTTHASKLEGSVLTATLRQWNKKMNSSSIDLNDFLGNENGSFRPGKSFFDTARNLKLTGPIIRAELADKAGNWKEAVFDLGKVMRQAEDNSVWQFDLPVVVGVPNGPAVEKLVLDEITNIFQGQQVSEFSCVSTSDGDFFVLKFKIGTSEDEQVKYFKTFSEEVSFAVISIGEKHGKKVNHMSAEFLEAEAGVKVGWTEFNGVPIPSFIGAEAHLNIVTAECGPLDVNVGISLDTGIGIKDGSLNAEIAGCGITIGKTIGISVFGSSISLDLGAVVDWFSGG